MNTTAQLYFKTAICLLLIGMGAGIGMAASGVHTIYSAHAHLNLLGFVVMSIYGAYFALYPAKAEGRLPRIIWALHTVGVVVMFPALAYMLLGNPALEPIVALSSIVVFIAALMFGYVVWRPAGVRAPLASPLSTA
ncbi:hypothetical protein [Chthonobacter albigriseus]|uniref:hypothetical protein n=1 Tax=Chthonobacter albigriseus TaxID=1683161 RepID=UPI0015EF17FF|nr:hypothetical protein [Chthonobacter albigriseus]